MFCGPTWPDSDAGFWPFFGSGAKTRWFLFLEDVEGIVEDSCRTERAAVKVPALGLRVSLPWHCLGEPPITDQSGRDENLAAGVLVLRF